MNASGNVSLRGRLSVERITPTMARRRKQRELLWWKIRNEARRLWQGEYLTELWLGLNWLVKKSGIIPGAKMPLHGRLYLKVRRADGSIWDYGQAGCHLIVDDGHEFVVDAWQNTVELEDMRYHGIGTGSTAPVVGNTALETEITTQYSVDNTRATGSLTENGAKVFQTVGTVTVDAAVANTEWGLLSQAATGGGVLFDRQTYTVVNLANGDSLQATYDLTVS